MDVTLLERELLKLKYLADDAGWMTATPTHHNYSRLLAEALCQDDVVGSLLKVFATIPDFDEEKFKQALAECRKPAYTRILRHGKVRR